MKVTIYLAVLLLAAVTISAQTKEEVFKMTKNANDSSLQGHVERNVDKIVGVYTEDAIILPPGGVDPLQGIKAIREYYVKGFDGGKVLKAETENISFDLVGNKGAVEVGRYTLLFLATGSEKPVEIKGTMLIIWERTKDRKWKIKRDMWH